MKSTYLRNKQLADALTGPLMLALYRSEPLPTGEGPELTQAGYQRQPVTFGAPQEGTASNSNRVVFPSLVMSMGSVTHFGLFDAAGRLLYAGELSVDAGPQQAIVIEPGALWIREE